MPYSIEPLSEGCYEGTTVLINKFGAKNQEQLDELEQTITSINSAQIELNADFENVNFEFYKEIHKKLFYEIYDWAGKVRDVNMSKKGTRFCDFKDIDKNGNAIFKRLKDNNYFINHKFNDFIDEIVDLYCDLNLLHPFREGNGRVQRLFLTLLIRNAGYNINFSESDTELLMIATIKSVSGDIFMLKDLFLTLIKQD